MYSMPAMFEIKQIQENPTANLEIFSCLSPKSYPLKEKKKDTTSYQFKMMT